jgi:hypothetical protein
MNWGIDGFNDLNKQGFMKYKAPKVTMQNCYHCDGICPLNNRNKIALIQKCLKRKMHQESTK